MANVVGFTLLTTTGKLNYQLFKSDASSSDFELQKNLQKPFWLLKLDKMIYNLV